jgi:hypothetical protein
MEDEREDELRRPPAPAPYLPVDLQLRVSHDALNATLDLLQRAGRRESGVLWYGARDREGNGTVTYVVAPRQRMSWGNYHIAADALAEVVHRLPATWKPVAQVHSHPGISVEHSTYDDRMASSRRALSLVFPFYGRVRSAFPLGVGVHEWQDEYWHLLTAEQASRRVIVSQGPVKVEDLR